MPVLQMPPTVKSPSQTSTDQKHGYKPTEFTLAKFSPDKGVISPDSQAKLSNRSLPPQKV